MRNAAPAVGLLLCAGSAARMGFDKLTTPLVGKTPVERSAEALLGGGATALVLAASPENKAFLAALSFPVPTLVVPGGQTRGASVENALRAASALLAPSEQESAVAVIHDAARCLVSPSVVAACIESARRFGSGVAAAPCSDTALLETEAGITALPRECVRLTKTPQCFRLREILAAYEAARAAGFEATDDCTLYARAGHTPRFVEDTENRKLTRPADWAYAEQMLHAGGAAAPGAGAQSPMLRIGQGLDVHRLAEGRALVLGGVTIPYEKGLLGHSDADVLIHALIDALLGAAALGDIGKLFPDSDAKYKDIDSRILLRAAVQRLCEAGFAPQSADATIICQRPKLAPYILRMRENLAADLGLPVERVSVKATTTEGMNDEGRGLCISAQAVAVAVRHG